MEIRRVFLLLIVFALTHTNGDAAAPARIANGSPQAAAADWPWWRGPNGNGVSNDAKAVTKWSATENVLWKTKVPGKGLSSPIVVDDRVFLTSADEASKKQFVLAFDRKTGKPLWTTQAHEGGFMRKYGKNSQASATPACDGQRVYSVFINHDALHVTATDLDGKILWQKEVGKFQSEHGYGSSPVLFGSLVIVNGENVKNSFAAGLDVKSGEVIWKIDRKNSGRHGNYATPLIATLAGKPQLVMTGVLEVSSYDPATGRQLWSCGGTAEVTACTVACSDTMVFATGGYPEKELLAIRADGQGNVGKSHVAWRTGKGVTYVPSPLYHDGHLYVVADGGLTTCFEAATGKEVWQGRLTGNFSSSPVLVGNLLYASNEAGKTFVFKTGPKFELVATNELDGGILATPTICGGRIYLRTDKELYCIGQPVSGRKD